MSSTTFIVGKGVGDVKFGITKEEMPPHYKFVFDPEVSEGFSEGNESFGSEIFGMRVDFHEGKLSTIACRESLFFKGKQIIGAPFKRVAVLIFEFEKVHDKDEILFEDGVRHIIHVNELGLSFWLDESDIIRSVDCIAPWA